MRLRFLSIAFVLASLFTGLTWLVLQPVLFRALGTMLKVLAPDDPLFRMLWTVHNVLPFYLALNLGVLVIAGYGVLHFAVIRPLEQVEQTIGRLERLELELPLESQEGPVQARIQVSLRRMADALRREQGTTQQQLEELRAVNDRLTRAQTELVSAERLATVGRLAAGVAHEVGNPLSGILGYVSVAQMRASDRPELLDFLKRIEAEVQRIDQIVRGLLELGRPARDAPGPVELARIVESCVTLATAGPDFSNVKVSAEVAADAIARAQPGPLSQVIINLLLNAAQAMGSTGTLAIRAIREGDRVRLTVDDSGPGLSTEVRERMFEPFFTTKHGGKGNGLGLAVSLHLVSEMGGRLTGENLSAGGARFTVDLPSA